MTGESLKVRPDSPKSTVAHESLLSAKIQYYLNHLCHGLVLIQFLLLLSCDFPLPWISALYLGGLGI